MDQQAKNAEHVANFLKNHPKVEKVFYLGFIPESSSQFAIYKRQYKCAGAMLSFDVKGGEKEAFAFLNNLKLIKLAVSLGGTESLAEHPMTMTHAGVAPEHREEMGVTPKMVRLSVGVENYNDIIWDISQALEKL
jgi:methionine-gamma-lyase